MKPQHLATFCMGIILTLVASNTLQAQNFVDLLRYSRTTPGSATARGLGLAGQVGAMGSDQSSLLVNPASIGLYRNSEAAITFGYYSNRTLTNYLGTASGDDISTFNIPNIGFVISGAKKGGGKDSSRYLNFGFGFSRTGDFNRNLALEGTNTRTSILDNLRSNISGNPADLPTVSLSSAAYNAFLLDYDAGNGSYSSVVDNEDRSNLRLLQTDYISTKGSTQQIHGTVGGNLGNELYIGGTVGVSILKYISQRDFEEVNKSESIKKYLGSTFREELLTRGAGISATIGVIYRVIDPLKIGLSLQTPTAYSLRDDYQYTASGNSDSIGRTSFNTPGGTFSYNLRTPAKATLSASYIVTSHLDKKKRKKGPKQPLAMINADIEYLNYSSANLSSPTDNFRTENKTADSVLGPGITAGLGGELLLRGPYALRAGYRYASTPYRSGYVSPGNSSAQQTIALGIGYRGKEVNIDLGYSAQFMNDLYTPYTVPFNTVSSATNRERRSAILASVSLKF